ncbi:ferrous iron transport protein B [Aliiroseovarius crassostreae]|uniref:Ferrous iron transport protein B n=1 Tax=Aliiroseovarius crassostreae TaxID=154981 RepID=A0A0N8IB51_9RHOB|nr:Fe(2+) transporter permease subunit FeoB [Aliiroseovarius crassostreae]KPN62131.1 iron transporter FeoB [Aliiroseovarius crassostreae]SFU91085.1 ferrous iron transport protein B [Aliiroseovarius crassostreae]
MSGLTIAIAGNPNCGKTTLFNALTGTHQQVGNWPGVTVEKKVGSFSHQDTRIDLVDLPGVYSLSIVGGETSLDERIAREFILTEQPDLVVNVVDASNLERNLYLTVQLLEMGTPLLVALNMMDIARTRRIHIDLDALSRKLGCPVVSTCAASKTGLEGLVEQMVAAARNPEPPRATTRFSDQIEQAIDRLDAETGFHVDAGSRRWLAIKHLEGDELCPTLVDPGTAEAAKTLRAEIEAESGIDADTLIACGRYDFVAEITSATMQRSSELGRSLSEKLDRLVLNRVLGIPIFLLIMYLMFMFTINIGGAFIDFFDILAGTLFVDGLAALLDQVGAPGWLGILLATGVGGGIQTVATFIPIVACLFLFLSVLEDSGYMARAAFVMDRFMRMIGLPGKSFVPLIVGFGCNVPAIMATRTLDSQRDRTLTVMMAPFMSCGARLPVYALFAAAFFPTGGQNLVFLLYFLGLLAAVGTGLMLKATLLPGKPTPFIMELPAYHWPSARGIFQRSWHRLRDFLTEAGQVIVVMVTVLAFLNSWGTDGSFGNEDSEASVLSAVGRNLTPIFAPIGISEENWPATVGIFTGILAKEAVVGTLNTLYTDLAEDGAGEPASFSLMQGVGDAVSTIVPNLKAGLGMASDPLGLKIGDVSSPEIAAAEQEVSGTVFGTMATLFDGQAGAFAYLLLILLYMPCVAALGAIWRETSPGWAMFAGGWTMAMAYGAAVLFYQIATFARHPLATGMWLAGILGALLVLFVLLKRAGRRIGALDMPGRDPTAGSV